MDNNNNLSEPKSKPLSFKKSLKKARGLKARKDEINIGNY